MDGRPTCPNHHWHLHESKCCVFGARLIGVIQQKSFLLHSQCARSRRNVKEVQVPTARLHSGLRIGKN